MLSAGKRALPVPRLHVQCRQLLLPPALSSPAAQLSVILSHLFSDTSLPPGRSSLPPTTSASCLAFTQHFPGLSSVAFLSVLTGWETSATQPGEDGCLLAPGSREAEEPLPLGVEAKWNFPGEAFRAYSAALPLCSGSFVSAVFPHFGGNSLGSSISLLWSLGGRSFDLLHLFVQ